MNVSYGAALLAGFLSFLSPCVLPLVPGYLGFLNGLNQQKKVYNDSDLITKTTAPPFARVHLLLAAVLFVAGFITVFVLLGATSSLIGTFIAKNMKAFQVVGGFIIIILGMQFLGFFNIQFLNRDIRFMPSSRRLGIMGAFVVGLAFGFGWTPCVGPVLASILMISAGSHGIHEGAGLLLAYGIGMGLPFILVALFADVFFTKFRVFSRHALAVKWILGVMLVSTGVLLMSGNLSEIGFWLLRSIPILQGVG